MQQYLDENDKIIEIRLELRHPARKKLFWILVEGETDQRLYAKLIDGSNTRVERVYCGKNEEGGGLEPLRHAMSILRQETDRVIGIRDADFLHLNKQQETIDCLFLTDFHDAELMMLSCDTTFESVVSEYLKSRRVDFDVLRRQILDSIAFLGVIRWLNDSESLELNFKGIGFAVFSDSDSLCLDKHRCIQEIENRSPNKKRVIQISEIDSKLAGISDCYTAFL